MDLPGQSQKSTREGGRTASDVPPKVPGPLAMTEN